MGNNKKYEVPEAETVQVDLLCQILSSGGQGGEMEEGGEV